MGESPLLRRVLLGAPPTLTGPRNISSAYAQFRLLALGHAFRLLRVSISIVTPSFRNSDWLKLCVASVADQAGVEVEHIVQDAQSDDGTQEWLARDRRVQAYFEKDQGMYDAVNRGWRRAKGEILAYLNCDEQYLPGGLRAIEEFFRRHPQTDVVFADTVVVDKQGQFICCRKSLVPWKHTMWVYNPVITSSIFIHRRVLDLHSLFFDARWRDLGDMVWALEMVRRKLNMAVLRGYTSSFADTGENMNLKPNAIRERELVMNMAPAWVRRWKWPLQQLNRLRMMCHGIYWQKPFTYSIYTLGRPDQRVDFHVAKPTTIWWRRH
jgi:glycosyltransferase involved in cell wall biosynthesis